MSTPSADVSQFVINIIILIIFVVLFFIAVASTLSSRYYIRKIGRNILTKPLPFTPLENIKFKSHRIKHIRDSVEKFAPIFIRQDDVQLNHDSKRRNYAAAVTTLDKLWNQDSKLQEQNETYREILEQAMWSGEEISKEKFDQFIQAGSEVLEQNNK